MAGHLRRHHKNIDLSVKPTPVTQTALPSSSGINLTCNSTPANKITMRFRSIHGRRHTTLFGGGKLATKPHYEIPSRTHLTASVIASMYNNVKEKLLKF